MTGHGKCFDASTAIPEEAPDGCAAVLGYIGPDPEATHVWTLAEWQRFGHLRQFPAWVANAGASDLASEGTAQGAAAVKAARALGWREGRVIICDLEAWRDPAYWAAWKAEVELRRYRAGWYGSAAYAESYPCDWRWLASPGSDPEIPDGYQAKQYAWDVQVPGGLVNLSVVSDALLHHGGAGPRKG